MNNQFNRILDLVRQTGDTLVVTDTDGEKAYVVMDLDQYELMLAVEHDLGVMVAGENQWEDQDLSDHQIDTDPNPEPPADIWSAMKPAGEDGKTWDPTQMNAQQLADLEQQYQAFAARNVQEAIDEMGNRKQETGISNQVEKNTENPTDDEFGEEQFYLEPIE
jgi:hypothetical protein